MIIIIRMHRIHGIHTQSAIENTIKEDIIIRINMTKGIGGKIVTNTINKTHGKVLRIDETSKINKAIFTIDEIFKINKTI